MEDSCWRCGNQCVYVFWMRLLSPLGIYAFVVGKLSGITGILWGQVRKRGYSGLVSQFVESLVKIIFASQQSAFNYE